MATRFPTTPLCRCVAGLHLFHPAILLDPLHRRAEGVEMGDDGARAFNLLAPIAGEYRAPAGDAMADAEPVQLLADMADDRVRVAGRAGNGEELLQLLLQIIAINVR